MGARGGAVSYRFGVTAGHATELRQLRAWRRRMGPVHDGGRRRQHGQETRRVYARAAGHGYGGISSYGYPIGIAMARDGFGVIWESRGTLYVTRDGGSHWIALPKVARPEEDFGASAAALPNGVGYVLLSVGGSGVRRLIGTRDGGHTWHV